MEKTINEVRISTGKFTIPSNHKSKGEINNEPSMTDETCYESLQATIARYELAGQRPPQGEYDGEDMEFTESAEPSNTSVAGAVQTNLAHEVPSTPPQEVSDSSVKGLATELKEIQNQVQ